MKKNVGFVCLLALAACAWAEDPYEVEWKAQIGTSDYEDSRAVAVDASGNVYISGYTYGDLGGTNGDQDDDDAFLSKFGSAGNHLWTSQIGTSNDDRSYSVAVDAIGNIYISGYTYGDLGGTRAGYGDAFLSKFNSDGNEIWTSQIGTSSNDRSYSVAVDASGNVYISGETQGGLGGPNAGNTDAFLSKFSSDGNEVWTSQIGTVHGDWSYSVAVDSFGNSYISGATQGDLGAPNAAAPDVFVSKFDSDGNEVWTTQIGTGGWEESTSVAVDASGNTYISGYTYGDLGGPITGRSDAFLSKFGSDGNEIWTTQIGTSGDYSDSSSVAVDAFGNAYITGRAGGDLGGPSNGADDVFLSKFDPNGNELWTNQIGTNDNERSYSVALDASGNVYISGGTRGNIGGPNAGNWDAYLVKYEVPGPATLGLLSLGGLALLSRKPAQR